MRKEIKRHKGAQGGYDRLVAKKGKNGLWQKGLKINLFCLQPSKPLIAPSLLSLLVPSRALISLCFILTLLLTIYHSPAYAEKYLTKGEAVKLLSETDFIKKKIGALLSWAVGYDISKINRVKLVPTINYVKALPKTAPSDGRTIVELIASVSDPEGLRNISGVRADLSSIGRLSNTMLVDNGLWGDKISQDGIYALQTNVAPEASAGSKEIAIAVVNKNGWLAYARTLLIVEKITGEATTPGVK